MPDFIGGLEAKMPPPSVFGQKGQNDNESVKERSIKFKWISGS